MNKPLISVLVPTRKRVSMLRTMLTSLVQTASDDGANVEVIHRIDFDDNETRAYLHDWWWPFIIGPRYGGYATLAKMINEAARLSTADLILVANDDLEFMTKDWDLKLVEAAMRYPDGVFDLGVDTVLNNENFCFPCISRRVHDAFGFFYDERLLYQDIWMRDVMKTFDRAIRVDNVTIRHNWTGMTMDQQLAAQGVPHAEHDRLYDTCLVEGRHKVAPLLQLVTS